MKRNIVVIVTALVSLAVGAGGVFVLAQRGILPLASAPASATPALPTPTAVSSDAPLPEEIIVSVLPEAIERMHIAYGIATEESATTELRVPATVQPNAYRDVRVAALVGGVVMRVSAELGQSVQRGQTLATLFSRELAEAQTQFVGFQAQFEAEHKKLVRVQELVALGSASRQELEEVEATHQVHTAHVEEARQRLLLLGLSESQVEEVRSGRKVSSEVAVPAPSNGIITARSLNSGQVVSAGQELFTVTDLSSVWVEGNLLEDDFATVRKGSRAAMTTAAYPGRTYQGAVDYIDPRVDPQTRTAKVRVAVANKDLALRLGMYVDLQFARTGGRATVVPAQAIQSIGRVSVVYLPIEGQSGQFRQQSVTPGAITPAGSQVVSGIEAGQRVVTEGSFLLRAEALRQHPQ